MTPSPTVDLLDVLVEVERDLAQATSEDQILVAVARYAERHKPASMEVNYLFHDDEGRPDGTEIIAAWKEGALFPEHPLRGVRFKFDSYSVSSVWYSSPHEALVVEDVATDPRLDDAFRSLMIDQLQKRAFALLPLYSRDKDHWHGLLTITWSAPHAASPEERIVYTLLAQTITAVVAGKRAIASQQEALAEVRALYDVSDRLHAATTPEDILRAVAGSAIENGTAFASLGKIDVGPTGDPERLEILVRIGGVPATAPALERPIDLRQFPFARLWIEDPTSPITVADVATDPRMDDAIRAFCASRGTRAMLLMPLLAHGQWVGLITTNWTEPQPISARNARFYRSVARKAATALQNRLLFERVQAALRDEQDRRQLQEDLIAAQAAALVERSTPLIPITNEIVVMPIIGSIDIERGKHLLDALLEGVSRARARFAIIDITGAPAIDTHAAAALTGAARALRLLGVEPVLTGLRPDVARALVAIGIEFNDVATLATVQSGIAHATRRMRTRAA